MTFPATVSDFKSEFDRDFIYGAGLDTIRDKDITRAMTEGNILFNVRLWSSTDESKLAFLYLSAHCLVLSVQAAGGLTPKPSGLGVTNRGAGITQSKSVGQVSINYAIPQSVVDDPVLNQFMRTDYGQRYLQLVAPRLVGNIALFPGFNDNCAPGVPNSGI